MNRRKAVTSVIIVALVMTGCIMTHDSNDSFSLTVPDSHQNQSYAEDYYASVKYNDWRCSHAAEVETAKEKADLLDDFTKTTTSAFFRTHENENTVYSPLSAWFALALAAESAGGETRNELLALLGINSIQQLRESFQMLWTVNDLDQPGTKEYNAVSLWLDNRFDYSREELRKLNEDFYAFVFAGNLAENKSSADLQHWLNENTCDLMQDYISKIRLNAESVMSVFSALYYSAFWVNGFDKSWTTHEFFNGYSGPVESVMMRKFMTGAVYRSECCRAISMPVLDAGRMIFILPRNGYSLSDVYEQEMWQILSDDIFDTGTEELIDLHIPAFKVSCVNDLTDVMKSCGMKRSFDDKLADFARLTASEVLYLDKVEHAVSLQIDEKGINSSDFSWADAKGMANPLEKEEFYLNRPFLFFVVSQEGSIVLAGIYCEGEPVYQPLFETECHELPYTDTLDCFGNMPAPDPVDTVVLDNEMIKLSLPNERFTSTVKDGRLLVTYNKDPSNTIQIYFDDDYSFEDMNLQETSVYGKRDNLYLRLYDDSADWECAAISEMPVPTLVIKKEGSLWKEDHMRDSADEILYSIHLPDSDAEINVEPSIEE